MRRPRSSAPHLVALVASLLAPASGGCRLTEPSQSDASAEAESVETTPAVPAAPEEPNAAEADAEAGDTSAVAPTPRPGPVHVAYPGRSLGPLVDEVQDAVVSIRTTVKVKGGPAAMYPGAAEGVSLGSGFLIDTEGHVLTNDHVLAQAQELQAVLATGAGERVVPARIVGRAPELDVALLALDTDVPLEPVLLGDSSALHVGEWVVAMGNPFGREITASAGIISSTEGARDTPPLDASPMRYRTFLVTDAAIHAGNSGGPLVDTAGRVVGINVATSARSTGLGFAVPIDRVESILPMLKQDGRVRRSWLGVFIHPVQPAEAARRGLDAPRGALVSEVVPGSPAAKAGIRAGDIIVRFEGRDVDHRDLPWLSATTGAGRRIPIVVVRDGSERTLELMSELMPE